MSEQQPQETRPATCIECGAVREIESASPGVTKYKPCANCGAIGIVSERHSISTGTVRP